MSFDNGKSDLLIDKLSPLVIERGFNSYLDYYYLLKYDTSAPVEWQNVMNALSVQETYFWRELDQVRALSRLCCRRCWLRIQIRQCESGAPLVPPAKSR